jgi:DNA mismatch repair protein MutL
VTPGEGGAGQSDGPGGGAADGASAGDDGADAASDDARIRALDERTVQRIAAGEVVERPASVAKELVENSLDADASRVSVAVERGGTEGVRVRDDGRGMTEAEVRKAVREHTTSKIADIDDLEAGVGTLGFRGEALHTIGAVSRTTIRTRPRGSSGAGTELRLEGGEVTSVDPTGCPEGTTVEVEDLFFNTPARRKFLKTTATEFDHVNTVVTHYALANPDVAVSLEHDGREVFATEGHGSLESTVLSVYGREVAEAMVSVDHDPDGHWDGDADGPPVRSVTGLVSHPETNRSARDYLSTFVNGRYVTARALREAVLDAYGGQLAPDRYPFAVLFVDVPPETIDVNVHPRKMEVRFDDESGVRETVERAVESALLEEGLVRSSAPRGRSAPDEAAVRPDSPDRGGDPSDSPDRGGDPSDERVDAETRSGDSSSEGGPDRGGAPARGETPAHGASSSETDSPATDASSTPGDSPTPPDVARGDGVDASGGSPSGDARSDPEVEFDAVDDAGSAPVDAGDPVTDTGPTRSDVPGERGGAGNDGGAAGGGSTGGDGAAGGGSTDDGGAAPSDLRGGDAERSFAAPTAQRTLDGEAATVEPEFDRLPRMRVLGQLFDTYLVAETDDGLVLVDQHAADERVNYERLQVKVAGDTPTQALASPVELELTAREAALFEEYRDALAQVGFHAGRTGERTVEVRTVPAVVDAALDPELLRDALSAFVRDREGGRETVDAVADELLADLACYPSITGNTSLREGSVVDLLEALDDCENPYACPHGRPVIIEFDREEIGDRFERDYPGHAGRRGE